MVTDQLLDMQLSGRRVLIRMQGRAQLHPPGTEGSRRHFRCPLGAVVAPSLVRRTRRVNATSNCSRCLGLSNTEPAK
jgi:hypothetical protein